MRKIARNSMKLITGCTVAVAVTAVFAAGSYAAENYLDLGLPFAMEQGGKGMSFWNLEANDYYFHMEGKDYGWDSATIELGSMSSGQGPEPHTHVVEEFFVVIEGSAAFTLGEKIIHVKAPAVIRVPPNTSHNVTTLGPNRTTMATFFASNSPETGKSSVVDPFAGLKKNTVNRNAKRAQLEALVKEMDKNKDGKMSKSEAPDHFKSTFARYDLDDDGYVTQEEAANTH